MRILFFRSAYAAVTAIFFFTAIFAFTASGQTQESATLLGRTIVVPRVEEQKTTSTLKENNEQKKDTEEAEDLQFSGLSELRGYSTGIILYDTYIVTSSKRYSIDPLLIYAQMHQESAFKLRARSYKGASGLMQLMPATAVRFGVTDIYDPRQNIDAGVKYMRWLLNKFGGDVKLALAGYNAGEGAVMKYGNQIPPYRETQEYVRRIIARYNSISNQFIALPTTGGEVVAKRGKTTESPKVKPSEIVTDAQNTESENSKANGDTVPNPVTTTNTAPRTVLTRSLFFNTPK